MKKIIIIFLILLFSKASYTQTYTLDTLVRGIARPTAFTFMPNGNIIVNQQYDSTKIYNLNNQLISCFWNYRDSCAQGGESGLIGVCLDPNYPVNKYIYFYYMHYRSDFVYRIVRLTDNNNVGTNPVLIMNDSTPTNSTIHFGGNMRFGPDGKLYVTIGDNATSANSQSLSTFKGKILRINSNGTIPTDNPFYDDGNPKTGNDDRIWALGLRNSYDLTFSPFNDSLYASENGQIANDEINFIRKGKNYGWPICQGYCQPYNPLYRQPMDTIGGMGAFNYAPTGIMIYNGPHMPELYGRLLTTNAGGGPVTGLVKYQLGNLPFMDTIVSHSVILNIGVCTTILQGPDGYIYLAKYHATNGLILRLKYSTVGFNDPSVPVKYILEQNYPNPFNPATTIKYSIPRQTYVTLQIYDALGRELNTLVNENKTAGSYEVNWNAENFPSGVYFYKLTTDEFSEQKKMVLIK